MRGRSGLHQLFGPPKAQGRPLFCVQLRRSLVGAADPVSPSQTNNKLFPPSDPSYWYRKSLPALFSTMTNEACPVCRADSTSASRIPTVVCCGCFQTVHSSCADPGGQQEGKDFWQCHTCKAAALDWARRLSANVADPKARLAIQETLTEMKVRQRRTNSELLGHIGKVESEVNAHIAMVTTENSHILKELNSYQGCLDHLFLRVMNLRVDNANLNHTMNHLRACIETLKQNE